MSVQNCIWKQFQFKISVCFVDNLMKLLYNIY